MRQYVGIFLAFTILFAFGPVGAQDEDRQDLRALLARLQSLTDAITEPRQSPHFYKLHQIFPHDNFPMDVHEQTSFIRELEREMIDLDPGLSATAYWRTGERARDRDEGEDEEPDDLPPDPTGTFQTQAYLGLEWRVFRDGWYAGRLAKKRLAMEQQAADLRSRLERKQFFYPHLFNETIYAFTLYNVRELEALITYIDDVMSLTKDLYYLKVTDWEDILSLGQRRAKYVALRETYLAYLTAYQCTYRPIELNIDVRDLPILDLDLAGLHQAYLNDQTHAGLMDLKRASLDQPHDWLADVNLRLFAREEWREIDRGGSFSFGFSAGVPLRLTAKKRARRAEALTDLEALKLEKDKDNAWRELLTVYTEYRYKMADYQGFSQREALILERLRKTRLRQKRRSEDFQITDLLSQALDYRELQFERMELKRLLYLHLLEIYRWSGNIDPVPFLQPVGVDKVQRYTGKRGVYIWSESLIKHEIPFIIAYLQKNELDAVYLSWTQKVPREKIMAMTNALKENGLQVHLLISDNDLLFKPFQTDSLPWDHIDGVHLDIEPQMLENWRDRIEDLQDRHLAVTKTFSKAAKSRGKTVAVAVPTFYPDTWLQELEPLVDELSVMAYGITNRDKMAEKTEALRRIAGRKLRLALSCKDWESRFELEHFIVRVQSLFKGQRIALHDLEDLMNLDMEAEATPRGDHR